MALRYLVCASVFLRAIEVSQIRNITEGDMAMFRWEDFFGREIENECDEFQYELFKDQEKQITITYAADKMSVHGNRRFDIYDEGFVMIEISREDSGLYRATYSCSCTEVKHSDLTVQIEVIRIVAEENKLETEKIIAGEEVEIIHHERASCCFKEITWKRGKEIIFQYNFEMQSFISSQFMQYTNIEPTDPFILKYPQISGNHSGHYRVFLRCGKAIMTSQIFVKVHQIKDLIKDFALRTNGTRTKHCINQNYYLPWLISILHYVEALKLDEFEEMHLSLRFWSTRNIFQPWKRPLLTNKIHLKINETVNFGDIFTKFFKIKFGEHLGLYILKITLKYQNRFIRLSPLFYILSFVEFHTMSDVTTISRTLNSTEEICLSKTGFPYCFLRHESKPDVFKVYLIYEKHFDDCNYWSLAKITLKIYCSDEEETYSFRLSSSEVILSPAGNSSFLIKSLRLSKGKSAAYNVLSITFLPQIYSAAQCHLNIIASLHWSHIPNLPNAVAQSLVIA